MANYTETFTKTDGDTIEASDFETEFDAIATAIATKLDASAASDRADAVVETGSSTIMNMKILDIGDWNMDSSGAENIAHGLTFTKIRSISCIIRNDADSVYYNFPYADGDVININSININISRVASGVFDSTSFDSTSYNRGWLTIWYTD